MPVLAIPAAGAVLIVILVLIVLTLVYYLVSTIVALRAITKGLDEVISSVGEILEKSAPGQRGRGQHQCAARCGR